MFYRDGLHCQQYKGSLTSGAQSRTNELQKENNSNVSLQIPSPPSTTILTFQKDPCVLRGLQLFLSTNDNCRLKQVRLGFYK